MPGINGLGLNARSPIDHFQANAKASPYQKGKVVSAMKSVKKYLY